MKKLILYASLACIGVVSCTKEYAVPEDELPSFLGESIYAELKSPTHLQGTFNTYARLIEDMGYADVLGKTGSKTIFPANDEAFEAFFKSKNVFGATKYEDLTYNQKAQLLFSSMLDNAILIGNLSNQQNSTGELLQGKLIKHPSNMTLVQSVEPLYSQHFPANNKFFTPYESLGGITVVKDNTISPMVHFTGEYMLNNSMTVTGSNSDFEVITGTPYEDGSTYIFNNKVITSNVTCQNGYIHQLENVLVPNGNMAQMMRDDSQLSFFSRMVDYFCAPFYSADVTSDYNSWAIENKQPTIDKIYSLRYFSKNSQRASLDRYKNEEGRTSDVHSDGTMLNFDPGWNYYNPTIDGTGTNDEEIGAILAPTDEALWNYFKENGGGGSYIIKNLGCADNTYDNFAANLDAIYNNDPTIFANIINNLMKSYFSKTVPSKFATVQNDAFEFMGVTLNDVQKKEDGKFDVKIANNGVIYKMNTLFAPQLYNSVLGPASVYTNMRSMGQMLNDHTVEAGVPSALGADMYYYLLSMKSRYAVFVPEDNDAFIYIDPTSIYDTDGLKALRFRFDNTQADAKFQVMVQKGLYSESTGAFEELAQYPEENISKGTYKTQIQDMLNYHTVVLPGSQNALYGNHYYKTKHGGAIYVPNGLGHNGESVMGGAQKAETVAASKIVKQYGSRGNADADSDAEIENGTTYLINTPIQPTLISSSKILSKKFEKFYDFLNGFEAYSNILTFAGISDVVNKNTGKSEQTPYYMFKVSNQDMANPDMNDYRLAMLGAYNYTVYAPTDAAMDQAYADGLPNWDELEALFNEWEDKASTDPEGYAEKQKEARVKIDKMRSFAYYHIQNGAVFADKYVDTNSYVQTFMTDDKGVSQAIAISGGDGKLIVKDAAAKVKGEVTLDWNDATTNIMARDYEFKGGDINSSAFITIHGISRPLCFNASGKY